MGSDFIGYAANNFRRHAIAASVAFFLSLLFHIVFLAVIPFLPFKIRIPNQKKEEKKLSSFIVADVKKTTSEELISQVSGRIPQKTGTQSVLSHVPNPVDPSRIHPPHIAGMPGLSESGKTISELQTPKPNFWQPRQDVLFIQKRIASDDKAILPRRVLPPVERVPSADDFVNPFDLTRIISESLGSDIELSLPDKGSSSIITDSQIFNLSGKTGYDNIDIGITNFSDRVKGVFSDDQRKIKPIDNFLAVDVSVYRPMTDRRYSYFKMELKRRSPDILPVMPKNVLFVIDSSASMTEKKLWFCRQAVSEVINCLSTNDLFNVIAFNDSTSYCFDTWTSPNESTVPTAVRFIESLRSEGNTDIFSALKDVLEKTSINSSRPVLIFLITDGFPTSGTINSSEIIGEFSKLNEGRVSVFTFGTFQYANLYLLELLGYCNRGFAVVVKTGRWDIPKAFANLFNQLSRPILSNVRLSIPTTGLFEMYPVQTANMYLDRNLVLYGRCPRSTEKILFQVTGKSLENDCDMVCEVSLSNAAKSGGPDIRTEWAKQKLYHLIGQNAKSPSRSIVMEIQSTAKEYDVDIPHLDKLYNSASF